MRTVRPRCELLEARDVPTTVSLQNGVLLVTGTNAADIINLRQINGWLRVSGVGLVAPVSAVARIEVNGLGGSDYISLSALTPNAQSVRVWGRLRGGNGSDTLVGGRGADELRGDAGNDTLVGLTKNDSLVGGPGDDHMEGGDGNDFLSGGDGASGGVGNDTINGGAGNDTLYAGASGGDVLDGGDGDDKLNGGGGNDTLTGGNGNDQLAGDAGADFLGGGAGNDTLDGEDGDDTLTGGDGNDTMTGGVGNDLLDGGDGDDFLVGDDQWYGGSGADILLGGAGDDTLTSGDGDNTLDGGDGDDTLTAGSGNDTLDGGAGNDTLTAGAGNDRLSGGVGNDSLYGQAGADTLNGGDGQDGVFGGAGNDSLTGGAGADRFLLQGSRVNWTFTQAAATADEMTDLATEDAWIGFVDAGRYWANSEIERIDAGLALLHHRTNNATLLRTADGSPQYIYRQVSKPSGAAGDNEGGGVINIYDVGVPVGGGPAAGLIIHELGHNWDEPDETNSIDSFRALSGWRLGPVNEPGYTQASTTAWGNWWYLTNAPFASKYARSNPLEDFAESLAETLTDSTPEAPTKVAWMNDWLDSLSTP